VRAGDLHPDPARAHCIIAGAANDAGGGATQLPRIPRTTPLVPYRSSRARNTCFGCK